MTNTLQLYYKHDQAFDWIFHMGWGSKPLSRRILKKLWTTNSQFTNLQWKIN